MNNILQCFFMFCIALCAFLPTAALARSIALLLPIQHLTGNDVIVLGNLGLGQRFSFSVWVKPAEGNHPDWAALIDYRHNSTKSFAFHQKGSEINRFSFGIHSNNGVHGVNAKLKPSEWQHVVLVKAMNSMAIFINGKLVDRVMISPSFRIDYAGDEILTIGGWGYGNRKWLGAVSCVNIFDKPVTEKEILTLSNQIECKNERH